jgi:hypothetical protein
MLAFFSMCTPAIYFISIILNHATQIHEIRPVANQQALASARQYIRDEAQLEVPG